MSRIETDGVPAVLGFGDDPHIELAVDGCGDTHAKEGMGVGKQHANPGISEYRALTLMVVHLL
jgi:hypothetical protein